MYVNEVLGHPTYDKNKERLVNRGVNQSASAKAKKYQLDMDIKAFFEQAADDPWKIKLAVFDGLSEDLYRKMQGKASIATPYRQKFSSWTIKDQLALLFEIAGPLVIGWEIHIGYAGAAYKSSGVFHIVFEFSEPYTDEEGNMLRRERERQAREDAEREKKRQERIAYFKKVESTYNDFGWANGWDRNPNKKRDDIINKAWNEKEVECYATAERGVHMYISDKYKFFYYTDSTD